MISGMPGSPQDRPIHLRVIKKPCLPRGAAPFPWGPSPTSSAPVFLGSQGHGGPSFQPAPAPAFSLQTLWEELLHPRVPASQPRGGDRKQAGNAGADPNNTRDGVRGQERGDWQHKSEVGTAGSTGMRGRCCLSPSDQDGNTSRKHASLRDREGTLHPGSTC